MTFPKIELRKWLIIGCPKCGLLQIVRSDQKTRKCVKCGYTIKLDYMKLKVWYKASNPKDAVYILKRIKEQRVGVEHPKYQQFITHVKDDNA
jgi:DNA-directed RNA polymerase subunit M/transcription elongation factor TFIIS